MLVLLQVVPRRVTIPHVQLLLPLRNIFWVPKGLYITEFEKNREHASMTDATEDRSRRKKQPCKLQPQSNRQILLPPGKKRRFKALESWNELLRASYMRIETPQHNYGVQNCQLLLPTTGILYCCCVLSLTKCWYCYCCLRFCIGVHT